MAKHTQPANAVVQFNDFAAAAESISAIQGFLSLVPPPPLYAKFRQFLIFCKTELTDVLLAQASRDAIPLRTVNPRAPVFHLSARSADGKKEFGGNIAVLPGTQTNIYRIVTISYNAFWDRGVRKLVRVLYPYAMPVFSKQVEVRDALFSFERLVYARYELKIADATKKKRAGEIPTRGRLDTERIWTDTSIHEAFDQASEQNEWFTSIQFKFNKRIAGAERSETVGHCRVSKEGELNYDLMHDEISTGLVPILEQHASARLALLQNRGLRERNYIPSRPIEIRYPEDTFESKDDVRRFGQVIAHYPNATKAVFHSNPYYHASVADILDGSSFEIWVLSSNKVLLLPQTKASQQAFQRLIAHIFFEFKEGLLGEYNEG